MLKLNFKFQAVSNLCAVGMLQFQLPKVACFNPAYTYGSKTTARPNPIGMVTKPRQTTKALPIIMAQPEYKIQYSQIRVYKNLGLTNLLIKLFFDESANDSPNSYSPTVRQKKLKNRLITKANSNKI